MNPPTTNDIDFGDSLLRHADIVQNNPEIPKDHVNISSTDGSEVAHNHFIAAENAGTVDIENDLAIFPHWANVLFTKLSLVEITLNAIEKRVVVLEQRPSKAVC